jgi:hypothetical protein
MLPTKISLAMSLVVLGIANQANSQNIELRSVNTSVLDGAERERFLAAHNAARRNVSVDPVQWSDSLSNESLKSLVQQKDALIAQARSDWDKEQAVLPKHRTDPNLGENIAGWVGAREMPAEWAVTFWLRERLAFEKLNAIAPYRVGDEKDKLEKDKVEIDAEGQERPIVVGHYTAIVWRATRFIGAAKLSFDLIDDQGQLRNYVAIVCNYSPPGNRRGESPY